MKVWITKYALTTGIFEADIEQCDGQPTMVVHRGQKTGACDCYYHGEGKEWHRTFKSAVSRAEEMRDRKVVSMRKQLAKLKAMTFEEE